jgi:salicylate hydroxylase
MPADLRIAVVGGGIGGLTLAIALATRNVPCTVYEQAPEVAADVKRFPRRRAAGS